MKIEIEVDNNNYSELVATYLPQIKDLSNDPIVKAISYVPANLAGSVIKHIPQSALDSLVSNIVKSKKKSILEALEHLAEKKGFRMELADICVKNISEESVPEEIFSEGPNEEESSV